MFSFLGGPSSTRQGGSDVTIDTKRKRDSMRIDDDLESEEVHEHMPRQEHHTSRPQRNPRSSLNSSNQLPSRSADHNSDMAKPSSAKNLLRLPALALNRILHDGLVAEEAYVLQPDGRIKPKAALRYVEERENCWAPSSYVIRKPGILDLCKALREQAHRIFYSGNSFEIQVSAFNANALVPRWQRYAANLDSIRNNPVTIAIASDEDGLCNDMSEEDASSMRSKLDSSETYLSYQRKALLYQKRRQVPTAPLVEGGFSIQTQYRPHWSNLKEWLQLFHAGFLPALSVPYTDPTDQRLTHISAMFDSIAAYKNDDTWETAEKCLEGHRKILIADDEIWSLPSGEVQDQDQAEGNVEPSSNASNPTSTAAMQYISPEGSQTLRDESPASEHDFHRAVPFTEVSLLSDGDTFHEEEYQHPLSGPTTPRKAILSIMSKVKTGNRDHQLRRPAYGSDFSGHQSRASATLLGDESSSDGQILSTSRSSRRKTTPVGHFEGMDPVPSPKELDARKSKKRKTEHDRRVRQGSEEL
ncbi:hypothetical protein HII31_06489 [Pseudocercospora fuligena]|uniref:Uncharacterized protein n=1 Tax=Pseudocercospora fuligena TaxID=685502 RepID=A0A8H6VH26_9PEZI|nr:hypothetical protein HII31_06489 [Pseudocercospora fuligena]